MGVSRRGRRVRADARLWYEGPTRWGWNHLGRSGSGLGARRASPAPPPPPEKQGRRRPYGSEDHRAPTAGGWAGRAERWRAGCQTARGGRLATRARAVAAGWQTSARWVGWATPARPQADGASWGGHGRCGCACNDTEAGPGRPAGRLRQRTPAATLGRCAADRSTRRVPRGRSGTAEEPGTGVCPPKLGAVARNRASVGASRPGASTRQRATGALACPGATLTSERVRHALGMESPERRRHTLRHGHQEGPVQGRPSRGGTAGMRWATTAAADLAPAAEVLLRPTTARTQRSARLLRGRAERTGHGAGAARVVPPASPVGRAGVSPAPVRSGFQPRLDLPRGTFRAHPEGRDAATMQKARREAGPSRGRHRGPGQVSPRCGS